MSPFAISLRKIRFARGLRQQEFADRVGCERSYVSALENDVKQAPPPEFVDSVQKALDLSDCEALELREARAKSRRRYAVPPESPEEVYEFIYELFARLDRLSALQLRGLRTVLELGDGVAQLVPPPEGRIRRKDRRQPDQEAAM